MKIDDALYKSITTYHDESSPAQITHIIYYNIFDQEWPYKIYAIGPNDHIVDYSRPYNVDPSMEHRSEIDYGTIHNGLIKLGFTRFTVDYDDIYVNTEWKIIVKMMGSEVRCLCNIDNINDDRLHKIAKYVTTYVNDNAKIEVGILVRSGSGYTIEDTYIDKMNIDVNATYNDDIPVQAMDDFVDNENTGIMLLYGEPGTGKSTYIRHLIETHSDTKFVVLDANVLYDVTANSLLNIFIKNTDTIYIIEDCEKLLVSRNNETNPIISAFLNMTDGILANIINCKFICTFNTALSNIDSALLRKGRLKLKYEFKKLCADKVNKILGTTGNNDMTIADVVYNENTVDYSAKTTHKIGF